MFSLLRIGLVITAIVSMAGFILYQREQLAEYKTKVAVAEARTEEVHKYADELTVSLQQWAKEKNQLSALYARQQANIAREIKENEAFSLWSDSIIPVDDFNKLLEITRSTGENTISGNSK